MFWKNKNNFPAYWQAYLSTFSEKVAPDTPISELQFWVMDTETTGLNPKLDELLSIAGIPMENFTLSIAGSYECLLAQERPPGRDSIPIHGILPDTQQPTRSLEMILPTLLERINNRIIVGHHIRFDIQMLNKSIKAIIGDHLKNESLDTAELARRLSPFRENTKDKGLSLDELCRYYGLKRHGRHTAAGDSFLTARILCAQLKALEKQGVRTRKDLFRKPLKIHRF
jgi:DNA polymerase-3 subunit epsilon